MMITEVLGGGPIDGQLGENPDWGSISCPSGRILQSVLTNGDVQFWLTSPTQETGGQQLGSLNYANPRGISGNPIDNANVIKSILISMGLSGNHGYFAAGFDYIVVGDVGIADDGTLWEYVGSDPLPVTVAPGTVPSAPDYKQVTFNTASNVNTSAGGSVQTFVDSFALKIFQSPTDGGLTEIQTRTVNANEVYEVRKTSDDSLATIYSDAAGTTEIVQNGTDNKSGSDGVIEFYIADGDYYVSVGVASGLFRVEFGSDIRSLNDYAGTSDASEKTKGLYIPIGEYASQTLTLNDVGLKRIEGFGGSSKEVSASTLLFANDGIVLDKGAAVAVNKLQLKGARAGVGLLKTSPGGLTDSSFRDVRIENFSVGISATYFWSNNLDNIRIINCTKSFEFASQCNNLSINNFNAVNASIGSTFSNVEGVTLNAANISNQTGQFAFTMFQSYVVLNTPYFENISNNMILLGASSESNPSSLIINGGLIAGDIAIGGQGCTLQINGARHTPTPSTQIRSTDRVPNRWVNMQVSYNFVGEAKSSVNPVPILDIGYSTTTMLPNSSGGGVRDVELTANYYIMRQSADLNGVVITNDLVVGQQYTLVLMVRKKLVSGTVNFRSGSTTAGVNDSIIPDYTEEWVLRTMPFVPDSSDLRMLYKGDLQIKRIAIYEGILNTSEAVEVKPFMQSIDATSKLTGSWVDGTFIRNNVPTVDANSMILEGWARVSGVWEPRYSSNVSPTS